MRKLLILPVIGVLSVLSIAAAAGLNVTNDPVTAQAGSAEVLECDDSGVQLYPQSNWDGGIDDYALQGVTVAGIDDDCAGKTLKVTLTDAGGNYLAEDAVNLGGAPVANAHMDFTPGAPATSDVFDIHVSIQGG